MKNTATLGYPENRHELQIARWFQHEAAGLEVGANHEALLGPPDAGIFRAATRSRGLRREERHAGRESQRAKSTAESDLR
ncbi:MAG: hypothetical protein WBV79_04890, partial [Rhodomicrobium sp.]